MKKVNSLYGICIYHWNFGLCLIGYKSMDWINSFNLKCEELKSPFRLVRIAGSNKFLIDSICENGKTE